MSADTELENNVELADGQETGQEQPSLTPLTEESVLAVGPRQVDAGAAQATEHHRPVGSIGGSSQQPGSPKRASGKPKESMGSSAARTVKSLGKAAKLAQKLAAAASAAWSAAASAIAVIFNPVGLGIILVLLILWFVWPLGQGFLAWLMGGSLGTGAAQSVKNVRDDYRIQELLAGTGDIQAIRDALSSNAKSANTKLIALETDINKQVEEQRIEPALGLELLDLVSKAKNAVNNLIAVATQEAQAPKPRTPDGNQQSKKKSRVPGLKAEAEKWLDKLAAKLNGDARFGQIVATRGTKYRYPLTVEAAHNTYPGHDGLDMTVAIGTPVLAIADAEVRYADYAGAAGEWGTEWGGGVKEANHLGRIGLAFSNGDTAFYGHLSQIDPSLKPGSKVKAGQVIGLSGRANDSPHLHLTISIGGDYHNNRMSAEQIKALW